MKLAICLCDPGSIFDIAVLARNLHLPVHQSAQAIPADCTHVLRVTASGLELSLAGVTRQAGTRVDFLDPTLQYRLHTSGKRQGLGKAVGLDKAKEISVLDATAGLGRDALVLAHLGCHVTLVEQSPVMNALLEDGLRRAHAAAGGALALTLARMTLVHGDARQRFADIATGSQPRPDVVYLDPMFPPREKSASVKKDIALLQSLLGVEQDFPAFLAEALACATRRVVVKRPGGKPSGNGEEGVPAPTFVVPGKAAHFEVYVNSSFSSIR